MFGRNKGVSGFASDALETVSPYTDRLAHDEKLRERLVAALTAGVAARNRAQRQAGLIGLGRRLATDPILRAQLSEAAHQLQKAQGRVRKGRSHKARNTVLFVTSVGMLFVRTTLVGGGPATPPHRYSSTTRQVSASLRRSRSMVAATTDDGYVMRGLPVRSISST